MLPFDGYLDTLMENTFNQVSDIFGGDFDELGMDDEDVEQNAVTIDSRLDVDSVLIEDIKLDLGALDYKSTDALNYHSAVLKSEVSNYEYVPDVNKVIKAECSLDTEETVLSLCPQQRDRCNTWPRQVQEKRYVPAGCSPPQASHSPDQALPCVSEEDSREGEEEDDFSPASSLGSYKSKPNARRNPWGNSSYADLITMAVQSVPDRRLTLSQIYDWLVAAVPYFSERADSSSSAGWKNSIRHNLSLHQKFLKIPNEGAGKSSWWTLNPESNQAKKPRRRATSGDIRTLHCKREKAKKRVETLKITERLVRSSSISGLPPLSPSYDSISISGQEMFRPRANSSTSNHEGLFNSFRSRNLSSTSSTGQESPLHLDDLVSHDFTLMADNIKRESDLDNITLDDLNIEAGPLKLDPANILMDYLPTKEPQLEHLNPGPHKIKILEPREQVSFGKPGNSSDYSDGDFISALSYVTPLHTRDKHEHDEVRKPMIIKQLNQLTQKRFEILQNQNNFSVNNKKSLEDDFDLKIMLLQEELNKLTREEELLKINQYSSASNNPYFSVYNNSRPPYSAQNFRTETSPANSNAMEVTEYMHDYKSDTKSFNTTLVS